MKKRLSWFDVIEFRGSGDSAKAILVAEHVSEKEATRLESENEKRLKVTFPNGRRFVEIFNKGDWRKR